MSARRRASTSRRSRPAGTPHARVDHRKSRQLCRQVGRTIDQVLAGELDDDVLRGLCVVSVEPAPDDSHLLVTVGPMAPGIPVDVPRVLGHLSAAQGVLRSEVASAITRRKTPGFSFRVVPFPLGAEELAPDSNLPEEPVLESEPTLDDE